MNKIELKSELDFVKSELINIALNYNIDANEIGTGYRIIWLKLRERYNELTELLA